MEQKIEKNTKIKQKSISFSQSKDFCVCVIILQQVKFQFLTIERYLHTFHYTRFPPLPLTRFHHVTSPITVAN